jgi:hypothetical protein
MHPRTVGGTGTELHHVGQRTRRLHDRLTLHPEPALGSGDVATTSTTLHAGVVSPSRRRDAANYRFGLAICYASTA